MAFFHFFLNIGFQNNSMGEKRMELHAKYTAKYMSTN